MCLSVLTDGWDGLFGLGSVFCAVVCCAVSTHFGGGLGQWEDIGRAVQEYSHGFISWLCMVASAHRLGHLMFVRESKLFCYMLCILLWLGVCMCVCVWGREREREREREACFSQALRGTAAMSSDYALLTLSLSLSLCVCVCAHTLAFLTGSPPLSIFSARIIQLLNEH